MSSRKWIPRARWGKATLSKRWAKRTAAALVHIYFHIAHLEVAEAAAELGSEGPELKAVRDAITDFRPLKYDRDSTFLLYFSGRIRNLQRPVRPVILVLTCSFGGGHRAAAQAVSSYFAGLAEVQIIDTSKDSEFLEKDLVYKLGQRIGRPNWDQTTWFNDVILKRQLYGWVNVSEGFGKVQGAILEDGRRSGIAPPLRSPEGDSTLKRILRGQFLSYHPSLVITVYHMDINPIMALCEELGSLPLLHCATDLDVKMWEVFGRTQPLYPKFCVGVPFNMPASWDSVSPLSGAQVFLAGYPVRTQFLTPKPSAEAVELARETLHGLRTGERLVLVMTGGGGQEVPWPEWLANSTTWGSRASGAGGAGPESAHEERLRLVVIAGKNAALVKRLKGALREDRSTGQELLRGGNDRVSVQIARDPNPEAANPFFVGAAQLASLMDVASAAITKPGGGSTAELTYRRVPVVLDASKGAMHWEEFTIKRFEEAHCGVALRRRDAKELEAALRQCLDFPEATLAVDPFGVLLDTGKRVRARASMLAGLASLRRQDDDLAAGDTSPLDMTKATPDAAVSELGSASTSSSAEPPACSLLGGAGWWQTPLRWRFLGAGAEPAGGRGWERSGPSL
ncbi:unnamed protein product [Prorocentrum cordatum]|uniref:Monogalactosyldiacylglycerol synthase n=1 Tax=Prorocentrum cordatum TaxID=2364126 RepID=A0ABN9Y6V0_9DINO|nr:unnamed protein product [Polarella glacialis]